MSRSAEIGYLQVPPTPPASVRRCSFCTLSSGPWRQCLTDQTRNSQEWHSDSLETTLGDLERASHSQDWVPGTWRQKQEDSPEEIRGSTLA